MKKIYFFLSVTCVTFLLVASCRKTDSINQQTSANKSGSSGAGPNAYVVTLESKTFVNGHWEWVWSVRNPNPGNGNNGTSQDLSHWGMQFGTCFNWASIAGAAISSDNINWSAFTPVYQVDPSQGCVTTPVLKFDQGTSGTAKTYYRLTLTQDYPTGTSFGYYKSGSRTGCGTFNFNGVSCDDNEPPPSK